MNSPALPAHLILFDGVCNFCNSTVQRVIKNDPKNNFYFTPLQSETGKKILQQFGLPAAETETIVYIKNGKAFIKSDAALQIAARMKFPYPLLCFGFMVPRFLRDIIYDYIARNRYRWFGKQESCMIPDEEQRKRFLLS